MALGLSPIAAIDAELGRRIPQPPGPPRANRHPPERVQPDDRIPREDEVIDMGVQQDDRDARRAGGDPLPGLLDVDLDVRDAQDAVVVRVRGDVDLATAAPFAAALADALDSAGERGGLVVDVRNLAFIDVGGVRSLARVARLAGERGVPVRLLSCPVLDELVRLLGGWAAVGAGSLDAEPPEAVGGGGLPAEYAHLAPLLAEHARLPADHPRRQVLRAELITGYRPVARHIARRFRNRGEDLEDLEQVAMVGLINAVDRFEVGRGVDFLAFAVPTITGEVQRHYRDRTSTIRIPRRIRGLQAMVLRAVDELRQRRGAAPRPSEIARYLDLDPVEVIEALESTHRNQLSSLDEPFPGDEVAGENPRYAAALAVRDSAIELVIDHESLDPLLNALPDRERRILLLRFFGNKTQTEIAAELGISQMHVSRLLSRTLALLREGLDRPNGSKA
jgi:RNA polymerase sigma-B factor